MRVVRFLLGLYLLGCSTITAVFYFLPHGTSRMKQIFEDGYYQYLLWGFPPGVCIVACFLLGAWFVLSAFRSADHGKARTRANI
jgi:hypothetical protein